MTIRVVEVTHKGFIRHITRNWARHQSGSTMETMVVEEVILSEGMNSAAEYIGHRQAAVALWAGLRSLLEVYTRETGYEGGGQKQRM